MTVPWYNIGVVFLMGALGIWKAVPVGFIVGMNPILIYLTTLTGASAGIITIYLLGSRIKKFIMTRLDRKGMKKKKGQVDKMVQKYGTAGLGLLGPLLIGPNATMALGIVVIQRIKKLLAYTIIGTAVWSAALTLLGVISIELFSILFLNK